MTDFGLSKEHVRRGEYGARSFCGSYAYLAPEMLKKSGHGKAVDWYLLGVIIFEMITGLPPFYADDKEQLFENIVTDELNLSELKQKASKECIDLIVKVSTIKNAEKLLISCLKKILPNGLELKKMQLK